ncbi:7TM diverse intracellular signaling domain-containing protein [Croceimicrobium sp.]|uniref:hybrid sensor histidine kinase/response regulator n=1 Tax=Croceimicrobium sp. TaxID=2828340 RepID=UPI003BA8E6FA
MKFLSPLIFLLLVCTASIAQNSDLEVQVSYFSSSSALSIEDVQAFPKDSFHIPEHGKTEQGFSNKHYWLKLNIANPQSDEFEGFMELGRPVTDYIEVYQSNDPKAIWRGGDRIPFEERSKAHRLNVFPLELSAESNQSYLIHYKSDGETLDLQPKIYSEEAFYKRQYSEQLFLGLFYGMLFLSAVIYLFFYTGLREKAFLHYGLYVISIAMLQGSLDGFSYQYLFSSGSKFGSQIILLSGVLTNFFLLRYSASFLKVKELLPPIYNLFRFFYWAIPLVGVLIYLSDTTLYWSYYLSNINGLLSLILILITVVYLHFRVQRVDPFFLTGIFFLVMGLLAFVLNNLSMLPNNFWIQNSAKFGIALEVVFLSLSMTNLIGKLREEKERSQEEALQKSEDISAMKTYFMSNISHELRTPINAILGIATEQLERELGAEEMENYRIVRSASFNLLSNVNDILDFEQIEKGQLELDQSSVFDPLQVFTDVTDSWGFEARKKGLSFDCVMVDELPEKLQGDEKRFRQILNNLISNAVKFTAQGSVRLTVHCTDQGEHCRIRMNLSDTGIGMSQAELSQIFESFNQMKLNNKRRYGGLGLGLTIVQHLVKLFGAKIEVDSEPGMGTNVKLDLRLAHVKEAEKPMSQEAMEMDFDISSFDLRAYQGEIPDSTKIRVLVAEDNVMNQMILKRLLATIPNLELEIANDGLLALQQMSDKAFDIILMDLQMPNMDGYEATAAIRSGALGEAYQKIPIIAVTADATMSTQKRALQTGMDSFMTKPVRKEQLVQKIHELTGKMRVAS